MTDFIASSAGIDPVEGIGSPTLISKESELYDEGWERKGKHIFVLSDSGKPIFTRYGDEQELASTMGLISALIAVVRRQGDTLRCIRAGQRRIVCYVKPGLYFICISMAGEADAVLSKQLEFLYDLVLLMLTDRVHRILEDDSSKDLRDLLGADSTRLMRAACGPELTPPYIAFESLRGVIMSVAQRTDVLTRLKACVKSSGAALGILLHHDTLICYTANDEMSLNLSTADVLLLAHFVGNSK